MGFLFIFLYFIIIAAVIEINVIIFRLTGLEKEVSRFQVISMLTGTGFTTGESELILGHPVRRRLSMFLILFGAFSLAVIISSISNILADEFRSLELAFIAAGLFIIILFLLIPAVKKKLERLLNQTMEEKFDLIDLPIRDVLLKEDNDHLTEVYIHDGSPYIGKSICDVEEEGDHLSILFVTRGDLIIKKKKEASKLQEGDKLLIFGDRKTIEDLFKEKNDEKDSAH
ncbi:TrkA C-terminal domain-containing protein [Fictibacillus iocasae]|uniref:TrkA C-terminal domain-containing protein n=1 Tax=Fictibacillus iocasae TaxID=2715437 RepID=A0ABW2NS24_9BACL